MEPSMLPRRETAAKEQKSYKLYDKQQNYETSLGQTLKKLMFVPHSCPEVVDMDGATVRTTVRCRRLCGCAKENPNHDATDETPWGIP
eukprot:4001752-Amphidinium_carterae.1